MAIVQLTEIPSQSRQKTDAAVEYVARVLCLKLMTKIARLTQRSVVAIHGIYEDALQTWTDPTSSILWLRDLLPKRLHNVRVLIYSYKAEALTSPGEGTVDCILAHATTLVAELCADRQLDNAFDRPIVFICHGLGGLLAKRALAYSSSRRHKAVEHLRSIYTSTYGILFMGTPHNGINKEILLLPTKNPSPGPSQFMINLLKGSEMLNEINDQFAPLMKQFSIYNFWEELETVYENHRVYIVDQDSAAPAWDNVEKCGILAAHSNMTKFGSHSDPKYRPILEALSRYVRHAHTLIQSRWDNDLRSIAMERQQEVEELLQPPPLLTNDSTPQNFNQWCLIPRSPSTYFTGRQKHARDVRDMLGPIRKHDDRSRNKVLVIYGLGGSGKTQFCLKYVEDNKHRYTYLEFVSLSHLRILTITIRYWGVFWVDASSEKNIETGFSSIGTQAGRGATMTAGIYWLSRCTQPWLLILDNADDPDMDISEYCPTGGNGHILVTTRNPNAVEHATVGQIRFRGMEPHEAISFLLKAAYPNPPSNSQPASPGKWKIAEGIAVELGYLPLALAHAGATIRRNIYTLDKYLHYYLGHRKSMMSSPQVTSADEANIITTWEIPFQKIVSRGSMEHRDAVDLMHIFAFMHFETIPESIFQRSWVILTNSSPSQGKRPEILQSVWNEEAQARFRRAIRILCDHSIIDHEPSKASCAMHPVIHSWARDRLSNAQQRQWLRCTMSVLAQCISPNMEASGRKFRALLVPHINSCLQSLKSQRPPIPQTLESAAQIERFAWVYAEQCQWPRARELQQKVIEIRMRGLGKRHQDTILAQRSLGQTLWNLFEIKPAIDVQLQALNTLRWHRPSIVEWTSWPIWKPIHVPYCLALDDLTLTLWLAGRRELSKMTGERAVDGLTRRLGHEDPRTLNAMFNLARTYLHLGEHEKSRNLLVSVLRVQKHFFGLKHPDTLMTRNELGICLCANKRHLAAAQRLVENVLQARREILGDEHAYTLWSVNDLSKIYVERGRLDEAVKMLEDIIPIVKRTLGEDHVGMSMTQSNLGKAYFLAERWKEAEQTVRPLLARIPPEHPDWIHNMYGYTHIQFNLGFMEEAEENCIKMLDIIMQTKNLALDNPRTVAIADLLLRIYRLQRRENDIAAIKKRIPGTDRIKNEDRYDPYTIRKGSDASVNTIRDTSSKEGPTTVSDSRHTPSQSSSQIELPKSGPLPKLVVRRTF